MYDLIVFGASGFTGKYVVETIVKTLKSNKGEKFTYAVSGRSNGKLDAILKEVSDSTGVCDGILYNILHFHCMTMTSKLKKFQCLFVKLTSSFIYSLQAKTLAQSQRFWLT